MESCTVCTAGRSHLDPTPPPLILPLFCDIRMFIKQFKLFRKYQADRRIYACTLTLSPTEVRAIKQHDSNQSVFLLNKLNGLGFNGVFVQELTKKNNIHLHGFIFSDMELKYHKCRKNGFFIPVWGASNMIKALPTEIAVDKWLQYITKTLITPNIIEWLSPPPRFATADEDATA